ncbi:MAG: hypothetical protein ACM3SY_17230 [Candidatus Omnitrophota bacterium]
MTHNNTHTRTCEILETTLRDGSYAIDFKFTARDTAAIARMLEEAGFRWIEIGHGLGLHAAEMGKGDAAETDADYLNAVASVLKVAKFGMFCIPGIARPEDIDMAAEFGMPFIRIGCNITELEGTQAYFERAKKHRMLVSANLMKSYAVPQHAFGTYTRLAQQYGADTVVLVDSAGGLFPSDIDAYFKASRDACDVDLGYHGHNNLGMANANTLRAVELGATLVDTSLKGIGRSAGNAVTEMMVMILKKMGYRPDIDEYKTMDIAETYIAPLLHGVKDTPISIIGGYAGFHSGFLGTIFKYSEQFGVDPRELIVRVSEKDKVHAPEPLVEALARDLKHERSKITSRAIIPGPVTPFSNHWEEMTPGDRFNHLAKEVGIESQKKGKTAVLNIVLSDTDKEENFISGFLQESAHAVVGSMELSGYDYIEPFIGKIPGVFDSILLDGSIKKETDKDLLLQLIRALHSENILLYNDLQLWAQSVVSLIVAVLGHLIEKTIILHGENPLARKIESLLTDMGATVLRFGPHVSETRNNPEPCDFLVACDKIHPLTIEHMQHLGTLHRVIDAKIGAISRDCIAYLQAQDVQVLRPDMRAVIAGEIKHQIANADNVRHDLGRRKINDYSIVSGGLVGRAGEIVVDSLQTPTRIIGIAKGDGRVERCPGPDLESILNDVRIYLEGGSPS